MTAESSPNTPNTPEKPPFQPSLQLPDGIENQIEVRAVCSCITREVHNHNHLC